VTVSESKEREKGNNDLESSLLETETEMGIETEMMNGFFCKENGGLCFSVGGGDHFFKWYNRDRQTL
jgi:hypothetical protein